MRHLPMHILYAKAIIVHLSKGSLKIGIRVRLARTHPTTSRLLRAKAHVFDMN